MSLTRAASEIEAANLALAHCRQPPCSTFDEEPRGTSCAAHFANVRDALLAETGWQFAKAECTPAKLTPDPVAGASVFPFIYPLPDDALHVRELAGAGEDSWSVVAAPSSSIAAMHIGYTSATPPTVIYTRRIVNVAQWSVLFLDVFSLRLAARIAPLVGLGSDRSDELDDKAMKLLQPLKRREAAQKARTSYPGRSRWLDVRA